jgi:hypothetical protein
MVRLDCKVKTPYPFNGKMNHDFYLLPSAAVRGPLLDPRSSSSISMSIHTPTVHCDASNVTSLLTKCLALLVLVLVLVFVLALVLALHNPKQSRVLVQLEIVMSLLDIFISSFISLPFPNQTNPHPNENSTEIHQKAIVN